MTNITNLENDFDLFLDDQLEFMSFDEKMDYLENLKLNISTRIDDLEEEDEI